MKNTILHDEGAASLEVAVNRIKLNGSVIKVGLDVHARIYLAVARRLAVDLWRVHTGRRTAAELGFTI